MTRTLTTLGALCVALWLLAGLLLPLQALGAASPTEVMSSRPLVPKDRALFLSTIYPDVTDAPPASGATPTKEQVSDLLDSYLQAEFPGDADARTDAKAVFNSTIAQSKIPNPSLRAALAALKGTLAEQGIQYVLNAEFPNGDPKVTEVRFADCGGTEAGFEVCQFAIAEVFVYVETGQSYITVNPRYKAENPFLFVNTLAHETFHQDTSVANYEESVAASLDSLVYLKQLVRHASLARTRTELSQTFNTIDLIRLNSGVGSRLGLYGSNANRPVIPGSPNSPETSWWQIYDNGDLTKTPGNPLLGSYLANIDTTGPPNCPSTSFSKALLNCMDAQGNSGLTPSELVAAARAMKLNTNVEKARSLSFAYSNSPRAFRGAITSSTTSCKSKQPVTIYRARSGADQKLGTVTSTSNGSYTLPRSARPPAGSYYSTIARKTLPGIGVCLAAKSPVRKLS